MSIQQEIPEVVQWLQQKVLEANVQGLVVGLSGGIDSAVAAALMKLAFPDNSLAIILPIKSNPQDAKDAYQVAKAINITHYQLDLTPEHTSILAASLEQLAVIRPQMQTKMVDANLRARLRMSTIYAAANALNYLVVGTDNKAEVYTGYFTKYGDGGCDILPLADFTKGEITALARALHIPDSIINKPPSAGLWKGQTDEEEIGTTYQYIDAHLNGETIPERDLAIIKRLHQLSTHKRTMPPAYIRR